MTSTGDLNLDRLRARFAGPVTGPTDPAWDQARMAWNVAVDQRPAAVAQATSADDVVAAVEFARDHGLRVAPQGTGHGAAAMPDLADTLLLRTSLMNGFSIDPARRVARVEGGTIWEPVAQAASEHGLIALHGSSPNVGVAGYTLGGGLSWLARKHGLAANSVTAIEVVTADGDHRRVDGDDDLFWALRGGGHGFGVVTALEFALQPVTEIYAGSLFWPGAAAPEVLHAYREWTASLPDELTSIARLLRLPPLPEVPEPLRDVPVVDIGLAFDGDAATGEELIRPLREALTPMMDSVGTVAPTELLRLHGDPEEPVPAVGHHAMLGELPAAAVDALIEVAGADSGSRLIGVELRHLGGALARPSGDHGALGALDAEFLLFGVGIAGDPDGARINTERLDAVVEAMAPWANGNSYLNFAEQSGHDCSTAFGAASYERLQLIRRAVDPEGLFVGNHLIPAVA
jgi:hypothetical protein